MIKNRKTHLLFLIILSGFMVFTPYLTNFKG